MPVACWSPAAPDPSLPCFPGHPDSPGIPTSPGAPTSPGVPTSPGIPSVSQRHQVSPTSPGAPNLTRCPPTRYPYLTRLPRLPSYSNSLQGTRLGPKESLVGEATPLSHCAVSARQRRHSGATRPPGNRALTPRAGQVIPQPCQSSCPSPDARGHLTFGADSGFKIIHGPPSHQPTAAVPSRHECPVATTLSCLSRAPETL